MRCIVTALGDNDQRNNITQLNHVGPSLVATKNYFNMVAGSGYFTRSIKNLAEHGLVRHPEHSVFPSSLAAELKVTNSLHNSFVN